MRSFVVAKVIVVNAAGQMLALRRSKSDVRRPGQWDFPGGHTDPGEDIMEAALRETREEAGIDLPFADLKFALSEVTDFGSGTWAVFVAHVPDDTTVTLSDEHDEYRWMTPDEFLVNAIYDRQKRIIRYVRDNGLLVQNESDGQDHEQDDRAGK